MSTDLSRTEPEPSTDSGRPHRRWRWWLLPAALFVIWLAVGSVAGPYSGRLSEVQRNDTGSYLPSSAESQRVGVLQKKFVKTQSFPGVVLVEGTERLTEDDLAKATDFARGIPDLQIPVEGHPSVRIGDFLLPGPIAVVPSQDGRAALALLQFDLGKGIDTTLADGKSPIQRAVEVIREKDDVLQRPGVKAYLAGPAGVIADLVEAFGGIDGILLLVAGLAVLVILLVVYRSPVIPFLVLWTAGFALGLASFVVYLLADNDLITLDGQGQGILSILVVGAATDYSLLLVARYREELRRHDDRFDAMRRAWRRTLEPVVASGATVIFGLLCLLFADIGPTRSLGPVGAIGIGAAVLAALTFLPAVLVLPGRPSPGEHGRWVFWPGIPRLGSQGSEVRGVWARVARLVGSHPRRTWIVTALVLLTLSAFVPTFKASGIKQSDTFLTTVESVTGDEVLARHFPAGSGNPTLVITPETSLAGVTAALQADPGVASVQPTTDVPPGTAPAAGQTPRPLVVDGKVQLQVTLKDAADSPAAEDTVLRLRQELDRASTEALVGGSTAQLLDEREISTADRNRVIPLILLVIFLVLAVLLRALVAPLLLIVANVLSFGATLGASALVFNHVLGFPGAAPPVVLYGFVFLVALGIDYSIFLMTRVREESALQGTRPGVLTGLAVTGGVITSAGIVLAATFAALGVLPILFLAQIAFIVAFGVLLDTLVVRSLLVPALTHDLGRRVWLPGRLSRRDGEAAAPATAATAATPATAAAASPGGEGGAGVSAGEDLG